MTSQSRGTVFAAIVLGVSLSCSARAEGAAPPAAKPSAGQEQKAPGKPRPAVTISKETTFITEPLRPDGYPDYVAALNKRASEGVTPENNAAVPFWRAMGPGEIDAKLRERFFEMLGIAPLPEKGDYFIPLNKYAKLHPELLPKPKKTAEKPGEDEQEEDEAGRAWEAQDEAMKRPWIAEELPLIAGWLAANDRPIRLLVEASNRPRRYDPLVGSDEDTMVIAVLLPGTQQLREAARVLKARAMLRLGEGKVEEAWADLLAVHRLGRLAGEGATLIDALVAIAIDGIACQGDNVLVASGKLTAAQALRMRDDVRRLPAAPRMADRIDLGERCMYMDAVCTIARKGVDQIQSIVDGGSSSGDFVKGILNWAGRVAIDWDVVLRMGDEWYDRMVAAGRKPTRAERKAAMGQMDRDIKDLAAKARDPKSFGWALLGSPRQTVSERMGQIFVALLLPAVSAACEAEDRAAMTRELAGLGFALAAYRADHGRYPARLADLAPKYVDTVPGDLFSGGELRYRAEGDGFVLYSVGRNEKDDGGRGYDDRGDSPESGDWDDLVVRVPLRKAGR